MTTKTTEAKQAEKKQDKRRSRGPRRGRRKREESEFDQKIIDVSRVTRVTEGGKQMSFRATVAIGDHKGRVGLGTGKGLDVTNAINKAVGRAKKDLVMVPLNDQGTIPHAEKMKFGAAVIMVRPAPQGTGIIAGGVMRMILELSGIKNVVGKMYGSKSKINNSKATIEALRVMKTQTARDQILGK
jgi:small subunit ribosomal protein S5